MMVTALQILVAKTKLTVTCLRHYAKHVVGKYKINSFVSAIECYLTQTIINEARSGKLIS